MDAEVLIASVAAFLAGAGIVVGWNVYSLRRFNEKIERELNERRTAIKSLIIAWEERLKEVNDRISYVVEEQVKVRVSVAEVKRDVDHIKEK